MMNEFHILCMKRRHSLMNSSINDDVHKMLVVMMPMVIFINYYINYLNWIILNVKYFINGNDEYAP
jgi:dolichyl-phosphate-mannose--protein O-mannosyl transferase